MRTILATIGMIGAMASGHCQGTIQFSNNPLSAIRYQVNPTDVIVNAPTSMVVGVFWGTNKDDLKLVLPLATLNSPGVFSASATYPIPGTLPGQTVYLKVAAWNGVYGSNFLHTDLYGEAGILPVTLGPTAGPGTVIWQGLGGTNAYRFKPFIIGTLETMRSAYTYHFIGTTVARGPGLGNEAVFNLLRYDPYFAYPPMGIPYGTEDATALAGRDYVATNGFAELARNEISQRVRIHILPSDGPGLDRHFNIRFRFFPPSPDLMRFESPGVGMITDLAVTSVKPGPAGTWVDFVTVTNHSYALEASDDLTTWVNVAGAESVAGTGGVVSVLDPNTDCCIQRFYRAQRKY